MFKLTRVPFSLLLSLTAVTTVYPQSAGSENITSETPKFTQVTTSLSKENRRSTWDKLVSIFRKEKEDSSTQGDIPFCSISPNPATYLSWRERPHFFWEGTIERIEIYDDANASQPYWSYDVPEGEQSVIYSGSSLQPGQQYTYRATYEQIDNEGQTTTHTKDFLFMIMNEEQRQNIQNELSRKGLDSPGNTTTTESLALRRATFFGETELDFVDTTGDSGNHDLFLDVVAEMLSISSPSLTWRDQIEALSTNFCD